MDPQMHTPSLCILLLPPSIQRHVSAAWQRLFTAGQKKKCFIDFLPFTAAVSKSLPQRENRTAFCYFNHVLKEKPEWTFCAH